MATNIFKGLGIALVTPFKTDGSIDYVALKRLIEYQTDNGADFLCILGTTSESPCLDQEERAEIKRFVVNKPSQEGLYRHFKMIADNCPLPVVLYNVPGRTGINLKSETTIRLANDCRNIVAVKEAGGSLEQVDEIIKNKPSHFDVLSGDDALTFPMIASGAAGVISVIGNALPREFSRMIRLEFNGEYEPARKIHHRFTELYSLLFVDGNPAGVKALLHEMGFIENELRLPLVPTRVATVQKMAAILQEMRI